MLTLFDRLAVSSRTEMTMLALAAVTAGLLIVVLIEHHKLSKSSDRNRLHEGVGRVIASFPDTSAATKALFDLLAGIVQAENYAVYLSDGQGPSFQLKSVRRLGSDDLHIEVGYGRLTHHQRESYRPPLTMDRPTASGQIAQITDGDVPLLYIPLGEGTGFITIGPVKGVQRVTLERLEMVGHTIAPALALLARTNAQQQQVVAMDAANQAARSFTQSTMGPAGAVAAVLHLSISMACAVGGCVIHEYDGRTELIYQSGLERAIAATFSRDQAGQQALLALADGRSVAAIDTHHENYWRLPPYLVAAGVSVLIIHRVKMTDGGHVLGAIWYNEEVEIEQHRRAAFQLLMARMGEMVQYQNVLRQASSSYTDAIQVLVTSVDNLKPYTVGHSELVASFAGVIAQSMGLAEQEYRDITLAAFLHDLGMLSLSGEQLFKAGKYTETEYATMKLHAEIGGSIIEATTGNSSVAQYVRHHHERWDGHGYPDGLRQDDIPLGARIIAVADMLVAKLSARQNRPPIPFDRALTELRAVAGSQLDPSIVGILLAWYQAKQTDPAFQGRTLGPCWGMRCCPPSIRSACPAGSQTARKCWEIAGVKCAAHGNECSTCFVRSEYNHRMGMDSSHETANNS